MATFPDPFPGLAGGMAQLGEDIGGAVASGDSVSQPGAEDHLESAFAQAQYLAGKGDLDATLPGDGNPATVAEHYRSSAAALADTTSALIRHPQEREAFLLSAQADAEDTAARIARERQDAAWLERADGALAGLRDAALKTPDEAARERIVKSSHALIAGLEDTGLLTREQAQQKFRGWGEDYAVASFKARPAGERLAVARALADGTLDPGTSLFGLIPQDAWPRLQREADLEATKESVRAAVETAASWNERLGQAVFGADPLPPVAEIEDDPALDRMHRALVLRRYNDAAEEKASFEQALLRFKDNQPFNPADAIDRRNAGGLFRLLGGDEIAAKAVVQRTGIVPDEAARKFPELAGEADRLVPTQPVQIASNDPTFVPADGPKETDGRSLDSVERVKPDEMPFAKAGDQQEAASAPEHVRVAQNVRSGQGNMNQDLTWEGFKKHPFEKNIEGKKEVNELIEREAKAAWVNPRWLKIIAYIESGGDPNKVNEFGYTGLFQFGKDAWEEFGMGGDKRKAADNIRAAINEFIKNRERFLSTFRREPTLPEMYLMHQQGWGGASTQMKILTN
jgi:hypothetical protein